MYKTDRKIAATVFFLSRCLENRDTNDLRTLASCAMFSTRTHHLLDVVPFVVEPLVVVVVVDVVVAVEDHTAATRFGLGAQRHETWHSLAKSSTIATRDLMPTRYPRSQPQNKGCHTRQGPIRHADKLQVLLSQQ